MELEIEINIYRNKIENGVVKETWVIKHLPTFWTFISEKEGDTLSEKFYLLDNKPGYCKICNIKTEFLSYKRGYRVYCSKTCSNGDPELCSSKLSVYKTTNLERYGKENTSQVDEFKIKTIITNLEKWGTKHVLQSESVKEKIRRTNMVRLGVDNPSKSEVVKDKKKETTFNNWGVQNPFQSSDIKEKIKGSNLKKWGVEYPMQSDEVVRRTKETNLKKWGVDNYKSSEEDKLGTLLESDIRYIKYISESTYLMECDDYNHNYEIRYDNYYHRKKSGIKTCTVCNPVGELVSIREKELLEFIASIYNGKVIQSYRDVLEIDIYLPELGIGFEFNGVYWHSEKYKGKWYHINKTNHFKERGIRIIHIWEDDWINKRHIILSQIRNWIGLNVKKIWARKCHIKTVSVSESREFLDKNHIQGYVSSVIKIGLYFGDELVSLMTFDRFEGRKNMECGGWNLSRFCNKIDYSVVGSASKLLKYFIEVNNPSRIISFADKEWSIGGLYSKLGFNLVKDSNPGYKYVIEDKRVNKQRFKKSNLIKDGFDSDKSESVIMNDRGYYKVWDCGQLKFEMLILST